MLAIIASATWPRRIIRRWPAQPPTRLGDGVPRPAALRSPMGWRLGPRKPLHRRHGPSAHSTRPHRRRYHDRCRRRTEGAGVPATQSHLFARPPSRSRPTARSCSRRGLGMSARVTSWIGSGSRDPRAPRRLRRGARGTSGDGGPATMADSPLRATCRLLRTERLHRAYVALNASGVPARGYRRDHRTVAGPTTLPARSILLRRAPAGMSAQFSVPSRPDRAGRCALPERPTADAWSALLAHAAFRSVNPAHVCGSRTPSAFDQTVDTCHA